MKFLIINSGDHDVGLPGFEVTIEVEDRDGILEHHEDFVSNMKDFLKKQFECEDGRTSIMTQEEFDYMVGMEEPE